MGRRGPAGRLLAVTVLGLLCLGAAVESESIGSDSKIHAQEDRTVDGAVAGSSGGGSGLQAAADGPQDDSVRCRFSGICDFSAGACNGTGTAEARGRSSEGNEPGLDPLACLTGDAERAAAVREAARHAWSGYRDCAWGEDELQPLSCAGVHWLNLSLTMVDSLDTLYLLGMRREFEEAAGWLADHLDVGAPSEVNLFETTIRVLGGLLSAQALSKESHPALSRRLAEKAAELGARLMPAFSSPSGVPYSDVNLHTGEASPPKWGHISSLSEMCSVSLEFTYLARITGHVPFEEVPLAVHDLLEGHASDAGGLLGQYFDPLTGKAHRDHGGTITLGARADSYYEYLLKQWLLTGKTENWLQQRYVQAMQSVRSRLLQRTGPEGRPGLWYVAEQTKSGELSPKMDHLVCFLPGLLALGDFHNVSTRRSDAYGFKSSGSSDDSSSSGTLQQQWQQAAAAARRRRLQEQQCSSGGSGAGVRNGRASSGRGTGGSRSSEDMPDLQVAHELALTCYELYRRTPAGLAPEIAHFANNTELQDFPNRHVHDVGHGDFSIKPQDAHNLLRPESVESFYLLWKVTGDPTYKQWAWQVFRAFEKWTRVQPEDRHGPCTTCMIDAAFEAAHKAADEAAVSAAQGAAAAAAAGSGGSSGSSSAAEARQQQRRRRHERAVAAAAEVLQRRLQGSELCASCSSTGGYTSLESVLGVPPQRRDKMESFFLAETLKYLYLIFVEPPDRCLHPSCRAEADTDAERAATASTAAAAEAEAAQPAGQQAGEAHPQQSKQQNAGQQQGHQEAGQQGQQGQGRRLLPLDRFVFTTEAHPLPVVGSSFASHVARVLESNSPLLRPFESSQCSSLRSDGSGGGGTGGTAAAARQQQQQRRRQRGTPPNGDAASLQALEAVLGDMLQRLSSAAAALAKGQPRVPAGASDGAAAAAAAARAAAAMAAGAADGAATAAMAGQAVEEQGCPAECPAGAVGAAAEGAEEGEEDDPYEDVEGVAGEEEAEDEDEDEDNPYEDPEG